MLTKKRRQEALAGGRSQAALVSKSEAQSAQLCSNSRPLKHGLACRSPPKNSFDQVWQLFDFDSQRVQLDSSWILYLSPPGSVKADGRAVEIMTKQKRVRKTTLPGKGFFRT